MADNLESYFKKHLSDGNPPTEDWNTPSDDVWNKALPEIQKKRGLFIPWKYIYIIGALCLVGLTLFVWPILFTDRLSTTDSNSLTGHQDGFTENANLQENLTMTQEEGKQTVANPLTSEADENIKPTTEIHEGTDIENQIKNISSTENASRIPDNTKISETETARAGQGKNISTQIEQEHQISNQQAIYSDKSTKMVSPSTIVTVEAPRQISQVYIVDEEIDIFKKPGSSLLSPPETKSTSKPEPFNNKGKLGIGAFFAPTLNGTSLNGNSVTGEIQTSDMFLYSGNWGFELKYFLSNRFALVTGIEKSMVKSWSKSFVDFGYDSSTEHDMGNGEMENTADVPMQTPFGEIDTEITYRFSDDQHIPDGEVMNSELETHQEVRYLSIPFGVEFNILRFSRFSWFTETGLRYNRALKDATQFSSRILHAGDDMAVVDEQMMSHPTYTENYLNFYVGTGMNYQFSSKFQINASGRYFGNITDVNLQGDMSTYAHGYTLKIGILYLF